MTAKKTKDSKKTKKPIKVVKKKKTSTRKPRKPKSKFVKTTFDVTKHILVPKHILLNDKEKEKLFEKYNITEKELPKILLTDPAIRDLKPKIGDVIKIERKSPTSRTSIFYRGVVNE